MSGRLQPPSESYLEEIRKFRSADPYRNLGTHVRSCVAGAEYPARSTRRCLLAESLYAACLRTTPIRPRRGSGRTLHFLSRVSVQLQLSRATQGYRSPGRSQRRVAASPLLGSTQIVRAALDQSTTAENRA